MRWRHRERGMIDPIEFINLAEQTGLIVPIGEFVLEAACRQLVAWDGDGIGAERCSVSVNVSGPATRGTRPGGTVERVLQSTGLEPERLTLELTESMLLDDVDDVERAAAGAEAARRASSRSTTSAPATRRSATCGSCPSTT